MIGTYFEAGHFDLSQQIQLIIEEQKSDIAEYGEMIGDVIGFDVPDRRRFQNVFTDRIQFIIESFEEKLRTVFQQRANRRQRQTGRRRYLVGMKDRRTTRSDTLRPVTMDIDRFEDFAK